MKAKSIQGKSIQEISQKLENVLNGGFKPTLAFVFVNKAVEIASIQSLLHDKNITAFGVTTYCHFTGDGDETVGLSILLMDINPEYFKVVLNENKNLSPKNGEKY